MNHPKEEIRNQIKAKLEDSALAEKFFSFIDRCESVDLVKLIGEVDDSDYSLRDWIKAFLGFDQWLTNQGNSGRDFDAMLGYMNCCQMMIAENVDRPDLQAFVSKVLIEFGFDPDQPAET